MASATKATVDEVAHELVNLCRAGRNMDAIKEFYSPDIVSIESMGNDQMPARTTGLDAIKGKNEWWAANHDIHSATVNGPYVGDGQFATHNSYDVTFKPTGNRMTMTEMALYTVKDGKIVQEEFFYKTS